MDNPPDPTDATDPALSRRAFVGLGAGAALVAASAVPALSADALGKPHPPLVAENDPALTIARPTLSYEGRTLDAYAAQPKDDANLGGAIVVVQAVWGVDAQLRDTVRRLAKEGYVAIAPALYSGLDAPNGDGATDFSIFRPFAGKLVDGTVDKDIAAAAAWALHNADPSHRRKPAPRAGVLGFCMGGGIALRQTSVNAHLFSAAAVLYGDVTKQNAADVKVPLSGSFGGRDTSIPADAVRAFAAKLSVPYDVRIYSEAGHAFFDDTRSSYVATAAIESYERALGWFGHYLESKT